jgi:hypothetical protein
MTLAGSFAMSGFTNGAVLTWVFPVLLFAAAVLWLFFQRRSR